jgi:uncharacterized protein (DUF697 family)/GTP-binding protein EngB required for normal cell division
MTLKSTTSGLLLIVVLACVGLLLAFLPTYLVERYETAARLGPPWSWLYVTAVSLGGILLFGSAGWLVWLLWSRQRHKAAERIRREKSPSELSAAERTREIEENLAAVEELRADPGVSPALRDQLEPLIERVEAKRESKRLEIVAFGSISSGKSSVLNALAGRQMFATDVRGGTTVHRNEVPWPGDDRVVLVDTPGLGEIDAASRQSMASEAAKDADLVILVVDGPLRDFEFRLLEQLGKMEKRVLVCLNKEDWFSPADAESLRRQIAEQVGKAARAEDVVAVRARPAPRTRVRVGPEGSESTEQVAGEPDIEPLGRRMLEVVRRDGSDLLLANLLLQSRGLVGEARRRVAESLDRRAWEIVDKYMWGAGGAAALSPWPLVDIAASCAISAKMVLDLARVYRQDVDLNTAVGLLGQLGKNLLSILGATAATPLVATLAASLLKSVPGVGTIAGGVLQGVVQALVTRWIGSVFIDYFKNEMHVPEGGLASLARRHWEVVTSVEELRRLVTKARSRLTGEKDA